MRTADETARQIGGNVRRADALEKAARVLAGLESDDVAAEESFPEALKALGPELSQRNLLGSPADIVKRTADYADAGVTALDLKPIYHSVDELLAMMQTFAAEVMPATA